MRIEDRLCPQQHPGDSIKGYEISRLVECASSGLVGSRRNWFRTRPPERDRSLGCRSVGWMRGQGIIGSSGKIALDAHSRDGIFFAAEVCKP